MFIALVILSIVCIIQFFFIIRFARTVFQFEDRIEIALDKIDESYRVVSEILERPLFIDSPEIREVHRQIGIVNAYLLTVASDLANVEVEQEEE